MTEPRNDIFVGGVNALVVLNLLVKYPDHFNVVYLYAPVGAFLWKRKFVKVMNIGIIRRISYYLIKKYPKLFKSKFTSKKWSNKIFDVMKEGYSKSKSFNRYFESTQPEALNLFEWIPTKIEIIWGRNDQIVDINQLPAWDSILARADLGISITNWGHYPYFDQPEDFVKFLDSQPRGFRSHTKAGRNILNILAGLPVPFTVVVDKNLSYDASNLYESKLYAIRSSSFSEDKIDQTNTGKYTTYLRIKKAQVMEKVNNLFESGIDEVIIQEFIEPEVSGVAFVRNIASEIEYIIGHLESLVNGTTMPNSVILTKMAKSWKRKNIQSSERKTKFSLKKLNKILRKALTIYHYQPIDVEWGFDGKNYFIFQIRPIGSQYQWKKPLSSVNIDEILPKEVSNIILYTQKRTSLAIGKIYSLWDSRILEDNEGFFGVFEGCPYLNLDFHFARFRDWGLPGWFLKQQMGGNVPKMWPNPINFFLSSFKLLKMHFISRTKLISMQKILFELEQRFEIIRSSKQELTKDEYTRRIVVWYLRFSIFMIEYNLIIGLAITSGFGKFMGRPKTVYNSMLDTPEKYYHRIEFESDPGCYRDVNKEEPKLQTFPKWNSFVTLWHYLGLPGMAGYYLQVREWFRDNNMRLTFKLHKELLGTSWLEKSGVIRNLSGTFWSDNPSNIQAQNNSFVIYPGKAEGTVPEDILIVDHLEPGHFNLYKTKKAVVALTGGRLSHGSTILRELQIPSAVMTELDLQDFDQKLITYNNGKIEIKSFNE